MAMSRPRRGSVIQPRPSMRLSYENFKPRSEWKYEDDATILLLYLSGFVKEQIRIEIAESSGLIKIQGHRRLVGGRWSIFNQSFTIPLTCDSTKITTQFELGILTIVMPISTSQNQNTQAKTAQQEQVHDEKVAAHDQDETTATTAKQIDQEGVKPSVDDVDHKKVDGIIKEKTEAIPEKVDNDNENVVKNDQLTALVKEKETSDDDQKTSSESAEKAQGNNKEAIPDGGKSNHIKHISPVVVADKEMVKSEGQVLLNVVIAVLVIMGLGVHIYSTIVSSKTA
ncbi:hypothetical protein ACOSP7_033098 [Xanthoceras sorbifolium]